MYSFDPVAARRALAGLSLTRNQQRFADHWLIRMDSGAAVDSFGIGDDIAPLVDHLVRFEVRPRQRVIWRGAGRVLNEGLGADFTGRDYTAMVEGADRVARLTRMTVVASGCLSLHSRWVTNTAGRVHMLREIALPCGMGANGAPQTMTYVEIETGQHVGQLNPDGSALGLAASFDAYPLN